MVGYVRVKGNFVKLQTGSIFLDRTVSQNVTMIIRPSNALMDSSSDAPWKAWPRSDGHDVDGGV